VGGRRRAADRGHSRRWTQDAVFGGLSICGGPLRVSGCGPPTYSAASRQLGRFRFRPHPCRRCRRPDPSSCSSCVVRRSACRLRKGADARQRLPKGYNAAHNDGQQAAVPHCQELRTHRTQQPAQETAPVVQSFSPGAGMSLSATSAERASALLGGMGSAPDRLGRGRFRLAPAGSVFAGGYSAQSGARGGVSISINDPAAERLRRASHVKGRPAAAVLACAASG
jgi:hypothetical protein